MNYLNSSHLVNQVIEEEKCTDEVKDEEDGTIYHQVKEKSYSFMKLEQHDPDDADDLGEEIHPNVIDVYWYPPEKLNQIELCKLIYKNKFNILQNILSSSTDGYDKVTVLLF